MSDFIVSVEHLSKRYLVGHRAAERERYTALRDVISREFRGLGRRAADLVRGRQIVEGDDVEEFWALKDVSFGVKRGEVLGIIGRNGAGKSTLLKILSRITDPSEGRAVLRGRLASLLEVGTGFHPELTGRQNIFLNGAVLGMQKAEVRRKFDEIVAFAEVEKFLDTPVKRYSSGMYVRLAFAVAAHLEPEILAIDEVLAVGDADFQKKCIGKMNDVARDGRTVLFVSHNMHAVEKLCRRVVFLHNGRIEGCYDDVRAGIVSYLTKNQQGSDASLWINSGNECANDYFVPERLEASSANPASDDNYFSNEYDVHLSVTGTVRQYDPRLNIGLCIYSEDGQTLFWSFPTDTSEEKWLKLQLGQFNLRVTIPARFLNEGTYRAELIADLRNWDWLLRPSGGQSAFVTFSIQGGLSDSPLWYRKRPGVLAPVLEWTRF